MKFNGVIPILATPFKKDESIDFISLKKLIEFMQNLKVDGITVLGVLGEANRINDIEREMIIKKTVSLSKEIPVIVGVSATGSKIVMDYCSMAENLGADAVMITPHKELNNQNEKIFELFKFASESTKLPIVIQDHPASSNVIMNTNLISSIVNQISSIACIKAEAVPTAKKISDLKKSFDREINILTGLGGLYAYFDLIQNTDGFNTGFAFPEILQAMVRYKNSDNLGMVYKLYQKYLPLIVYEQQPGIGIRKEFLRQRGLIAENTVRHPGTKISSLEKGNIKDILEKLFQKINIKDKILL